MGFPAPTERALEPVEVTAPGAPDRLMRWGSGPVHLFALHGWGGSHQTFARVAQHLDNRFSLWALDLPGYGGSAPMQAWERTAYLARIADVFPHLPEGPLHLLGNCSGAIIGLSASLDRPDRFDRLVLVDPFAFTPWYLKLFLWPVVGRLFFWSTFANPLGRWFTNLSLASKRRDETDLTASFAEVLPSTAWNTLRILDEVGSIASFSVYRRPALILHGGKTFEAIHASVRQWRALWGEVSVEEIASAGHLPLEESPEAVAAQLARFLLPAEEAGG